MPIYEYECECGYRVECLLTVAQAQDNPFFCPKCKQRMTKLIPRFSFTFAQPKSKVNPQARPVGR